MDGRGRALDNVFIERLWRSLKYEEVYLHAYRDLVEARAGRRVRRPEAIDAARPANVSRLTASGAPFAEEGGGGWYAPALMARPRTNDLGR